MTTDLATPADVRSAAGRVRPFVRRTPVLRGGELDALADAEVYLKCENLQHTGSFKTRGACNAVFSLAEEAAQRGVATHSSGNHAAALARAARLRGIPCHIVMPENSSPRKIGAVRAAGVEPVLCEPTAAAREAAAAEIVERTGAALIHPFDDPRVVAGQGTAALEFLEEVPSLDVVLAPVGGGGLLSGTLLAVEAVRSRVGVVGAEPALSRDAYDSWRSGERKPPSDTSTIADGLRAPLGKMGFRILRERLDDLWLASEAGIARATRVILERARVVVEPSGAVPLAALMENRDQLPEAAAKVGLILTGGNLDLSNPPWGGK